MAVVLHNWLLWMCTCALPASVTSQGISRTQTVPIQLYSGYVVVVRGSIGDLEKRNLVIDTGAYPSVVDHDVAKKLGLSGRTTPMRMVDRTLTAESVILPVLRFGPLEARDVRVVVQDMSFLSQQLGVRVDAMIGPDVLARQNFSIDYVDKTLTFGAVRTLSWSTPMQNRSGMACLDVEFNGPPQRLLLDTGAAEVLLFSGTSWLQKTSGYVRQSSNLGGAITLRQVGVKEILLGEQNLGSRQILVSDEKNMDVYPFDGLLAPRGLNLRQIAFDFEHQVFSWETGRPRPNPQLAEAPGAPAIREVR
jgi:hypothetical protein